MLQDEKISQQPNLKKKKKKSDQYFTYPVEKDN